MAKAAVAKITSASTAEYFSKNLQQVGFSSHTKAVLTTVKEAVDNALDACEEAGILPEVVVEVEKIGPGSSRGADSIRVTVEDNGPGLDLEDVPKVFGEYLASSKFGRGRCSRGQQGIGISAVTTWAQLTCASGATVLTKTAHMRVAQKCVVEVDIKHNKGVLKSKEQSDWHLPGKPGEAKKSGVRVTFVIDGRVQQAGEGGLLAYLSGTTLVNPHLTLHYKMPGSADEPAEWVHVPRVSEAVPEIPGATEPHPHTMKLGEFIAHSHLFGRVRTSAWLRKGFSRMSDMIVGEIAKVPGAGPLLEKSVDNLSEADFKTLYGAVQAQKFMSPSTKSVLAIGEEAMGKSIDRLGQVDFFSVVSRKPTICDFKPVQVEVAVARLAKAAPGIPGSPTDADEPVTVLRFANRVPLQFDKAGCALFQAVQSVNWKAYGLVQPKGSLPQGPYVMAVSVVSPFIKFKNASKETVDASDELVEEIRRALIQAGQRLSRHIRKEAKAADVEEKLRHIEQFGPILVSTLCRIVKAPKTREKKATEGLAKLLGRDARVAEKELAEAAEVLDAATKKAEEAEAAAKAELAKEATPEAAAKKAKERPKEEPKPAPDPKKDGKAAKAEKPAKEPPKKVDKLKAKSEKARQQTLFAEDVAQPKKAAKIAAAKPKK